MTETVCLGSLPAGYMVLSCWYSVFGKYKKEICSGVWSTVIAVVVFLDLLDCPCVDFFWVFSVLLGLCYGDCLVSCTFRKGMIVSPIQFADVLSWFDGV